MRANNQNTLKTLSKTGKCYLARDSRNRCDVLPKDIDRHHQDQLITERCFKFRGFNKLFGIGNSECLGSLNLIFFLQNYIFENWFWFHWFKTDGGRLLKILWWLKISKRTRTNWIILVLMGGKDSVNWPRSRFLAAFMPIACPVPLLPDCASDCAFFPPR